MIRPAITNRLSLRRAGPVRLLVVGVAMSLLASACSTSDQTPAQAEVRSADPVGRTTNTVTFHSVSELDDPDFQEVGGWWLLADSSVVVRGELQGIVGREILFDVDREVWELKVTEPILGDTARGDVVKVLHVSPDDPAVERYRHNRSWATGDEAVFFLTPWLVAPGVAAPNLYTVQLGEAGVIRSDLSAVEGSVKAGASLLARSPVATRRSPSGIEDLAGDTRIVVQAKADEVIATGDYLGWLYADVIMSDVSEVWQEPGLEAEGLPPPSLPEPLIVRLPVETAKTVVEAQTPFVYLLTHPYFEGETGPGTMAAAGGALGVLAVTEIDHVIGILESARLPDPETRRNQIQQMKDFTAEFGRIPLVSDRPAPEREPDWEKLSRSPVTVDLGDVQVVFDRWFWALFDGRARVAVTKSGELILEGPVEGPDSVMTEEVDGVLTFRGSDGAIVARVTSEQLAEATTAAVANGPRIGD